MEMTDFITVKEDVKKKGFGTSLYDHVNGEPVYLSQGVRSAFTKDEAGINQILTAVTSFQKGDFGDAIAHGKTETEGHEYGRYQLITFEDAKDEDTAVWVHRAEKSILVYFKFER